MLGRVGGGAAGGTWNLTAPRGQRTASTPGLRRSGVQLLFVAVTFTLLLVTTGVALVRSQVRQRRVDEARARQVHAALSAQSGLQWALQRTGDAGAPWHQIPADSGSTSQDWYLLDSEAPPLKVMDCDLFVRSTLWTDGAPSWPPDYSDLQQVFAPVIVTTLARHPEAAVGTQIQIRPDVHPQLRYTVWAGRELSLSPATRLRDATLAAHPLRSNGHFTAADSNAVNDNSVIHQIFGSNRQILERPADFDYRVHPQNLSELRGTVDPAHDLEVNPVAQLRKQFRQSPQWVDPVDPQPMIDLVLAADVPEIAVSLPNPPDLPPAVVAFPHLFMSSGAGDSVNHVTVLTRVNLEGVFTLNARGGSVLLRSMRLHGTLLVYNLGRQPNPAWADFGLTAPLTLDQNCRLERGEPALHAAVLGSGPLPTLLVGFSAPAADPMVVDVRINLSGDRLSAAVNVVDASDSPTVPVISYPAALESYHFSAGYLGPDTTSEWPVGFEGLLLAAGAQVVMDNARGGATDQMDFAGVLVADTVRLGNVALRYSPPAVADLVGTSAPGLASPGVRVVPHSIRRLTRSETEDFLEHFTAAGN